MLVISRNIKFALINSLSLILFLFSFISEPCFSQESSESTINFSSSSEVSYTEIESVFSPKYSSDTQTIYIEDPNASALAYAMEVEGKYSAELSAAGINHEVNYVHGVGCEFAVCVTITLDYGEYDKEIKRNYSEKMSQGSSDNSYGSTIAAPNEMDPPISSENSDDDDDDDNTGSSIIRDEGPSRSTIDSYNQAVRRLENANRELESANSDLRDANSDLSSANLELGRVKSDLSPKESEYNNAVDDLNRAIDDVKKAGDAAKKAKQNMNNSKTEVERFNKAKNNLFSQKKQKEAELQRIEGKIDSLLPELEEEINQLISRSNSKIPSLSGEALNNTKNGISSHNQSVSDINERANIRELADSIDINVDALVDSRSSENVDIGKTATYDFKTPETHANYEELRSTLRYVNGAKDYVSEKSGEYLEYQMTTLNMAELGVELADTAFSENENEDGRSLIDKVLFMVDLAIDFTPGASFAKDVVSIYTGINPITKDRVSDFEKGIMLATLFAPAAISGSVKTTRKAAKYLIKVVKRGGKHSDKAKGMLRSIKNSDEALKKVDEVPCILNIASTSRWDIKKIIIPIFMGIFGSTAYANIPCVPTGVITDRVIDSAEDIGLDVKKGMDRYGSAAIGSISDDGVKAAAKRWGTLPDGKNQLFEHTVEYAKTQSARMKGLESRAGLPDGSLTKAASSDPSEVATAIKNMQNLADDIISNGAKKVEGKKVHYWKQSTTRPKEGIRVIEYEGKIQSVNPTSKKDWDKFNP